MGYTDTLTSAVENLTAQRMAVSQARGLDVVNSKCNSVLNPLVAFILSKNFAVLDGNDILCTDSNYANHDKVNNRLKLLISINLAPDTPLNWRQL